MRSRTRRRSAWTKPRLILLSVIAFLALIGTAGGSDYAHIQGGHWSDQRAAADLAKREVGLATVERVQSFAGEKPLQIVFGKDKADRKIIVWTSGNDLHAEYADNGASEEQVRKAVLAHAPDAAIVRAVPGMLDGEYVWEVFYRRTASDGVHRYYDYFRFSDGRLIDTYNLGVM